MRVIDIENIVTNMKDDPRFVLRCEELFHHHIQHGSGKKGVLSRTKVRAELPLDRKSVV